MADWQVGDLALCVVGGFVTVPGRVYTVSKLAVGKNGLVLQLAEFEHLERHRLRKSLAARFRKVTPPPADEFDRETIALMNRAPAKEPSNA
ncbi:hypothetical protein [Sphingopyxis sp. C-1]|uniref:hypothetical protein n=1 Tax=Sphingopyxis sp. C-1 TaxID=262667 RepID=UPI00078414DF|nr:hypothetical protein [Sphingopyxis sp. C-1]